MYFKLLALCLCFLLVATVFTEAGRNSREKNRSKPAIASRPATEYPRYNRTEHANSAENNSTEIFNGTYSKPNRKPGRH